MWSRISNIWGKEITDSLRDKKVLRQAILIPLVAGVFYAVFNPWISSMISDKARAPLTIPAQGIENAGQPFLDALKAQQITLEPFSDDLRGTIARGEKAAGLIIPPGFSSNVSSERTATLTLLTNRTSGGIFGGGFSADRLNLAISGYSQAVATSRVEMRNISPALLSPISVDSHDLASPEQLAGLFAAFTLPILFASVIGQGGLFVAIDTTAGEKERGTLESLLVTPATDFEVFTGKLAAVFTVNCVPVVLTATGFWAASNFLPESMTGGRLPLTVMVGAVLLSIPLVLFVDVALMVVSIRTRAFKEAQSAAMPVGLFTLVPAMAAAFVTPASQLMYLIPVYGPSALISGIATGAQLPALSYVLALVSSLAAGAIAYVVALHFFNRERLLYGT